MHQRYREMSLPRDLQRCTHYIDDKCHIRVLNNIIFNHIQYCLQVYRSQDKHISGKIVAA